MLAAPADTSGFRFADPIDAELLYLRKQADLTKTHLDSPGRNDAGM